jgi:formylmethanofuran--tetrahydromethanopterin N-formyltransferase
MYINGVEIEDTFAEAFEMWAARLVVTAVNRHWALTAAQVSTGFATSIIGCGCEAGLERELSPAETPDGRPGVSLLFFARSPEDLATQLPLRVGQGVMPCPTTACFNGLAGERQVSVGGHLRYFGDGFQVSKLLGGRRFWRIPVMEGEFLVEESFGIQKAVAGGNLIILAEDAAAALSATESAVAAMRTVPEVVLPFPGGIARSGSKVGSRYQKLRASTNTAFCPTLRRLVDTGTAAVLRSALPEGVNSVLEIVVLGLSEDGVRAAMRVGAEAACQPGIVRISAGNYGGKLGRYQIRLWELWP